MADDFGDDALMDEYFPRDGTGFRLVSSAGQVKLIREVKDLKERVEKLENPYGTGFSSFGTKL